MWKDNLVPYSFQKRDIYYFSRRVPKDLEDYYRASKITLSLRTKSPKLAKAKSASLASQLEEEWLNLRWRRNDSPLRKFLHRQVYEARSHSSSNLYVSQFVSYQSLEKSDSLSRTIHFDNYFIFHAF